MIELMRQRFRKCVVFLSNVAKSGSFTEREMGRLEGVLDELTDIAASYNQHGATAAVATPLARARSEITSALAAAAEAVTAAEVALSVLPMESTRSNVQMQKSEFTANYNSASATKNARKRSAVESLDPYILHEKRTSRAPQRLSPTGFRSYVDPDLGRRQKEDNEAIGAPSPCPSGAGSGKKKKIKLSHDLHSNADRSSVMVPAAGTPCSSHVNSEKKKKKKKRKLSQDLLLNTDRSSNATAPAVGTSDPVKVSVHKPLPVHATAGAISFPVAAKSPHPLIERTTTSAQTMQTVTVGKKQVNKGIPSSSRRPSGPPAVSSGSQFHLPEIPPPESDNREHCNAVQWYPGRLTEYIPAFRQEYISKGCSDRTSNGQRQSYQVPEFTFRAVWIAAQIGRTAEELAYDLRYSIEVIEELYLYIKPRLELLQQVPSHDDDATIQIQCEKMKFAVAIASARWESSQNATADKYKELLDQVIQNISDYTDREQLSEMELFSLGGRLHEYVPTFLEEIKRTSPLETKAIWLGAQYDLNGSTLSALLGYCNDGSSVFTVLKTVREKLVELKYGPTEQMLINWRNSRTILNKKTYKEAVGHAVDHCREHGSFDTFLLQPQRCHTEDTVCTTDTASITKKVTKNRVHTQEAAPNNDHHEGRLLGAAAAGSDPMLISKKHKSMSSDSSLWSQVKRLVDEATPEERIIELMVPRYKVKDVNRLIAKATAEVNRLYSLKILNANDPRNVKKQAEYSRLAEKYPEALKRHSLGSTCGASNQRMTVNQQNLRTTTPVHGGCTSDDFNEGHENNEGSDSALDRYEGMTLFNQSLDPIMNANGDSAARLVHPAYSQRDETMDCSTYSTMQSDECNIVTATNNNSEVRLSCSDVTHEHDRAAITDLLLAPIIELPQSTTEKSSLLAACEEKERVNAVTFSVNLCCEEEEAIRRELSRKGTDDFKERWGDGSFGMEGDDRATLPRKCPIVQSADMVHIRNYLVDGAEAQQSVARHSFELVEHNDSMASAIIPKSSNDTNATNGEGAKVSLVNEQKLHVPPDSEILRISGIIDLCSD